MTIAFDEKDKTLLLLAIDVALAKMTEDGISFHAQGHFEALEKKVADYDCKFAGELSEVLSLAVATEVAYEDDRNVVLKEIVDDLDDDDALDMYELLCARLGGNDDVDVPGYPGQIDLEEAIAAAVARTTVSDVPTDSYPNALPCDCEPDHYQDVINKAYGPERHSSNYKLGVKR